MTRQRQTDEEYSGIGGDLPLKGYEVDVQKALADKSAATLGASLCELVAAGITNVSIKHETIITNTDMRVVWTITPLEGVEYDQD